MKKLKKEKGITLVALVITIILLLILAGVTLSIVFNEGLIEKSQIAVDTYSEEQAKEKLLLDITEYKMGKITGEYTDFETYIKDIKKGKIENTEDGKYKVTIYGYEFILDKETLEIESVNKVGNQPPQEQEKTEEEIPETLEYIQEGLVVWYDGENNTGNGHDSTVNTWTNLAQDTLGQNDGTLMNIDFTEQSGWTNDSLILDGINDWVKMSYLYYENMTIEIVAKPLDIDISKVEDYLSNFETGGIGIRKGTSNYMTGQSYIGESYKNANSTNLINIGTIYSMSTGYDGANLYFRENSFTYKEPSTGTFVKPEESTIFVIGTNPKGNGEDLPDSAVRPNIEVYSVRIYNRCLTEQEIQHNYEIDKARFNIP